MLNITPNHLSVFRLCAAPVLLMLLVSGHDALRWAAFALFLFLSATDAIDGWLARHTGTTTPLGAMLDQISDKIVMTAALLAMVATGILNHGWVIVAFVLIAREILVSGLREYSARHHVAIPVSTLGKSKTFAQFLACAFLLFPVYVAPVHMLGLFFLVLSLCLSLLSAYAYAAVLREKS